MGKFVREISSGGVVFRKVNGKFEVCLTSRKKGKIWCLPKGIVEEGESLKETAVREVKEETGLSGQVIDKIGDIIYWYSVKNKAGELAKIFKRVYFFLLEYCDGDTEHHDFEVDEAKWFPIDKALNMLSHENEKEIMKKAKQMLSKSAKGF